MTLLDSGILSCIVQDGAYLELEDGQDILNGVRDIFNGKKFPVLVDMRKATGASSECRRIFQGKEIAQYQSACALIVDSPITNLLGNFFLGLNKTEFPTRLFSDSDKAQQWLKSFL